LLGETTTKVKAAMVSGRHPLLWSAASDRLPRRTCQPATVPAIRRSSHEIVAIQCRTLNASSDAVRQHMKTSLRSGGQTASNFDCVCTVWRCLAEGRRVQAFRAVFLDIAKPRTQPIEDSASSRELQRQRELMCRRWLSTAPAERRLNAKQLINCSVHGSRAVIRSGGLASKVPMIRPRVERNPRPIGAFETGENPICTAAENISRFTVHWSHKRHRPGQCAGHQAYLDSLCADFETRMNDAHPRECVEVRPLFYGRQPLLNLLTQYLAKPASSPLICYGVSGCGKNQPDGQAGLRHAGPPSPAGADGTDDGSRDDAQATRRVNDEDNKTTDNIQSVKNPSNRSGSDAKAIGLYKASLGSSDSIDQLKPDDSAHSCFWLRRACQKMFWFVLDPSDSKAISAREQLRQRDRILTDKQLRLLETCVARVRLPLYARCALISLAKWSSFSWLMRKLLDLGGIKIWEVDQRGSGRYQDLDVYQERYMGMDRFSHKSRSQTAPTSARESSRSCFAEIERKHVVLLVREALGYLTVSYAGLVGERNWSNILAWMTTC
uniref:ANK_REP_REGION domain-containing protein n=1 Tax=Macrostomum lignano TaxID=282301 RepID=A0A1I8FLR8_9PLAT